ncbi:MAG: hypothetical protein KDB00_28225, partial [Planctomycetales bacterium]|nr:hypothetical protein [Planctomycetales bacterium]
NQSVLESVSPEFLQPELQEPELTASDPTPMMVPSSNESTDVVELDFELPVEAEVVSAEESALGVYRSLGARIDIDTGVLDLSGTKITDEQLSSLADLPKLSSLSLENTAVGDLGLLEITRHQPNLQSLYLSKTKVSDAGLVCLGDLNKLSRLDLSSCDVHDEGIKHLHVLEGLTAIGLESTKVSDQGVMRLSEALRHGAVIQGPQFNLLGGERF